MVCVAPGPGTNTNIRKTSGCCTNHEQCALAANLQLAIFQKMQTIVRLNAFAIHMQLHTLILKLFESEYHRLLIQNILFYIHIQYLQPILFLNTGIKCLTLQSRDTL